MLGSILFGPLEVIGAMTGAGLVPINVFPGKSVAVGFFSDCIYVRIVIPPSKKATVVGYRKGVTGISVDVFVNSKIAATPPALFTSIDATIPSIPQRTTFPLTRFLESVPGRHNLDMQKNINKILVSVSLSRFGSI